jgi:radical SAM protein with 4Fe4S-binding SPASM domain
MTRATEAHVISYPAPRCRDTGFAADAIGDRISAEASMNDPFILPFPRVVRIEPAGACNLTCSHCPTGTVDMKRGVMSGKIFQRVLESIRAHLEQVKVVVLYHGGEPLLNKSFPAMAHAVKALGIPFVKTVSNGMLMTEETLEGIVSSGLDAIEFSLDGASPEDNDRVRRECDHSVVVTNVRRLLAYRRQCASTTPKVYISTTQFRAHGVPLPRATPAPVPEWLRCAFGDDLGEIESFKSTWAMRWPHMEVLDRVYDLWTDPEDTETRTACDHVENVITIRWSGEVVACCYDLTSMFVLGNVNETPLCEIWNNKKYVGLRRSIASGRFIPMCDRCGVVRPHVYLTLRRPLATNV